MIKVPTPRTLEAATAACDAVAHLDARIAAIGTERDASIATVNAAADAILGPLKEERDATAAALKVWWGRNGAALLTGKRKTIVLGGCKIGTKAASLALAFGNSDDFEAALAKLREQKWAKPYVRVSYAVDKKAAKDMLTDPKGKHAQQLRDLGFRTIGGADEFVLDAVQQGGTIAAA